MGLWIFLALIANAFGFREARLLRFDAAETADVDMKKLFASERSEESAFESSKKQIPRPSASE